jgi:hypothetical protein
MSVTLKIKVPNCLDRIFTFPLLTYRRLRFGYPFRKIYLGEGKWTILDPQDYYRYAGFKWCVTGYKYKFYAIRGVTVGPDEIKIVRLHRLIMNAPCGVLVDHRNGDSLDNRRSNLRLATHSQNHYNRRKRKNTSSRFIGVYFDKCADRWVAQIRYQGKQLFLGRFDSEIEAARAYDRAAIKYHGEFARLNFPREDYANETCI